MENGPADSASFHGGSRQAGYEQAGHGQADYRQTCRRAALRAFYRRALSRLSPEERERERSRDIPYPLSLNALSGVFFETGIRQGWLSEEGTPKGPMLLAVSGGGDSTALLWLFRTFCESRLVAAHFEHGIRGEESRQDARFVGEMARRWGIETEIGRADVPGSLQKGESLETGARRLRYAFFERAAEKHGVWGVALGHNREDVAETVLFHLLRGSGVRGAAGMPERRGIFFRPLLDCSRDFLRGVLRCRGIEWREDRTNAEPGCTRNFIRGRLMPLIESGVNARAAEHLAAFAKDLRFYREAEEERGDALLRLVEGDGARALFLWSARRGKVNALRDEEKAILVRAAGRRLGIPALSRARVSELVRLMGGGAYFEFQWGEGVTVLGDSRRILWVESGP
jgi:tRNA(Ile)-lysidine synthase